MTSTNLKILPLIFIAVLCVLLFCIDWYNTLKYNKEVSEQLKNDSIRIESLQNQLLDKSKEAIYWRSMFYEVVKCKPIEQTESYKKAKQKNYL